MAGRRTSRAFTLIELLVVVAIIALLISILVPALGRARAQTRLVKCQAQLREYGHACMYYLADFKDVFPPHHYYDDGETYFGYPHWFHLLDWYWRGTYQPPDPDIPLNEQEFRIARCPELTFDHDDNGDWTWNYTDADIGYGYNAYWLGLYYWEQPENSGGCYIWPNAQVAWWTKVNQVRSSAECLAFGDSHPAGGDDYGRYSSTLFYPFIAGGWGTNLGEGVSTRHMSTGNTVRYRQPAGNGGGETWFYGNGYGNCCFVDGHTEARKSVDINQMVDCRRYWDPWQRRGGLQRENQIECPR